MKKCVNTKFKEVGMKKPYLVRESSRIDKSKYFRFHKSHYHNTNKCIHMKDEIEDMIKNGKLTKYTQEDDQKYGREKKRELRS